MFNSAFDEDEEEDADANGTGGKKQRSWLGKIGKGMYRRTMNLGVAVGLVDAPMSKEQEVGIHEICMAILPEDFLL